MGTGNGLSWVINLLAILEEGRKYPKDPEKRISGNQKKIIYEHSVRGKMTTLLIWMIGHMYFCEDAAGSK